jgi:hypothetical protein
MFEILQSKSELYGGVYRMGTEIGRFGSGEMRGSFYVNC